MFTMDQGASEGSNKGDCCVSYTFTGWGVSALTPGFSKMNLGADLFKAWNVKGLQTRYSKMS